MSARASSLVQARRRRLVRLVAAMAVLASGLALVGCTDTSSQPTASATTTATAGKALPIVAPKLSCAALGKTSFAAISGAATTVKSAATVSQSSGGGAHQYCELKGTIAPSIGFDLLLPTTTYRQRYVQEGCEGLCGQSSASVSPSQSTGCAPVTNGAFIVGQDDEGHQTTSLGGTTESWAASATAREEFGYKSEHAFAVAVKAISTAFYGKAPAYNYYDGCSDGGREALMVAQRYPHDFNGVLAGAPAALQTALNGFEEAYLSTVDFRSDGSTILPASKATMLHQAVIKKCADPTLKDDTIQAPWDCDFDPASLRCSGADTATCLTSEQVTVVRKIYAGVVAADGTHLYPGGMPYGSETKWSGLVLPASGQGQTSLQLYGIGLSFIRWLEGSSPSPTAKITSSLFTVANLHKVQAAVSKIYDATDPDLSAFQQAGGKLIQYHGLADQNIPPTGSIAYRNAVVKTMGQSTADGFYRLYLIPSMNHCSGGDGPTTFDLLSPLMNWVERSSAPTAIIASSAGSSDNGGPASGQLSSSSAASGSASAGTSSSGGGPSGSGAPSGARPSGLPSGGPGGAGQSSSSTTAGSSSSATASTSTTTITRPIYPYPMQVKYKGSGSTSTASSYVAYAGSEPTASQLAWASDFPTY